MSHLSDIEEKMKMMKETMEKIGEKIDLEKEKSIQNFLQALVQCGEISQEKKESIESNVYLLGFFMKDLDDGEGDEEEQEDSDEEDSDEEDSDEEDEVFEGRTTFPEYQADVNFFIIRYIEKKWPEMKLCPRPAIGWVIMKKGSGNTKHPITLHGSSRRGSTTSGTVTGTYSDDENYKISLRGKKFKALDELLCIV